MDIDRSPHVHEAIVVLEPGADPRSVGAAVTIALCGAVEHESPCLWPNNHDIGAARSDGSAVFRTLFVAPDADVEEVHRRISGALEAESVWTLASQRRRPLTPDEERGAVKLARTPRRPL